MEPQIRYKEKSVIIHRDENGFGLRVGGQNPVFVDCVHENGAAWKAGVRKDDRIIKVNGTLVRSYDHQRVVQMIQNCTPFVNLTLHSPETIVTESFAVVSSVLQSTEPNTSGLHLVSAGSNNSSNNIISSSMQVHSLHQRLHHPHSISNNLNWLLEIGDDLFQDNHHQKQSAQQQQINNEVIAVTPNHQSVGVSKLIVSGPSPLISSHSNSGGGGKLDHRHNRNQSNTRDNPYYYYKTAPEKVSDTTSCNSATSSLLSQDHGASKASTRLSMVRSRSSSKMSIRSTSGKYKARNLGSRLVEDLRSLTITNSQTTPSSLSTSPSSSDLSDCDHQNSSRLDCLTLNSSNLSSGSGGGISANANNSASQAGQAGKSKNTTRRLEIIRELVDTEKTHTEKLKQLNDLLYKPIKAEGLVPPDQLKMVFSCHKTLLKIHRQIYKKLLAAQLNISEHHHEPLVGKALIEIFDGELGRRLEKAASTFCACQSTNTELLNRVTRKDTKAGEFLAQVANQQMLGRLGIKDLLASCFQRLTKYPLLLDNLLKATPAPGASGVIHSKSLSEGSIAITLNPPATVNCTTNDGLSGDHRFNPNEPTNKSVIATLDNNNDELIPTSTSKATAAVNTTSMSTASSISDEYTYERLCIERALQLSRQILIHVNEAVNRAIAQNKLKEVWKKTDKNPALPVIDIETQQLLHEGPLTLRLARRSFEVYVLLLTHYLVILTREGQDKYKLKYFTADGKSATQFSPIFNIDEHLATRDTATDENGFYLLCKRKDDSRIYEFASQSPAERAKWKEKIHMAQSYNFAAVPDDDNTLTRYTELISLETSSDTPNIIEHGPTNNNIIATTTDSTLNNTSLDDHVSYNQSTTLAATTATTTTIATATTAKQQQISSSNSIPHDLNAQAQDV